MLYSLVQMCVLVVGEQVCWCWFSELQLVLEIYCYFCLFNLVCGYYMGMMNCGNSVLVQVIVLQVIFIVFDSCELDVVQVCGQWNMVIMLGVVVLVIVVMIFVQFWFCCYCCLWKQLLEVMVCKEKLVVFGYLVVGVVYEICNLFLLIKGLVKYFVECMLSGGELYQLVQVMVKEVDCLNWVVSELLELVWFVYLNYQIVDINVFICYLLQLVSQDVQSCGIVL